MVPDSEESADLGIKSDRGRLHANLFDRLERMMVRRGQRRANREVLVRSVPVPILIRFVSFAIGWSASAACWLADGTTTSHNSRRGHIGRSDEGGTTNRVMQGTRHSPSRSAEPWVNLDLFR